MLQLYHLCESIFTKMAKYDNDLDELMTARQVAKILCCSVSAVYTLARKGNLPSVKIGGMIRFRPCALNAAINGLHSEETPAMGLNKWEPK